MSTTLRDRLTAAIYNAAASWDEPLDDEHDVPQIVNAVLAALAEAGIEVAR